MASSRRLQIATPWVVPLPRRDLGVGLVNAAELAGSRPRSGRLFPPAAFVLLVGLAKRRVLRVRAGPQDLLQRETTVLGDLVVQFIYHVLRLPVRLLEMFLGWFDSPGG